MHECEVHLEAQGSLVAVAVKHNASSRSGGGRRGLVEIFSQASRRRLLRTIARLDDTRPVFLTLTYPADYPDPRTAKSHLRAFLERFRRRMPQSSAIWRLEFQERGAPHFHLLFYNLPFISFETIRAWWREVIGVIDAVVVFVRIEMVKSRKGAMYYASKYLAKPAGEKRAAGRLFNHDAYLHAKGELFPGGYGPLPSVGRFWGVFNRAMLPMAAQMFYILQDTNWRDFHDAKRAMRRHYARITKQRAKGGVIFYDKAYDLAWSLLRLLTNDLIDERIDYGKWARYGDE